MGKFGVAALDRVDVRQRVGCRFVTASKDLQALIKLFELEVSEDASKR